MPDPFATINDLPRVAEAVTEARAVVDRLLGHRVLRRHSAEVSTESALRGARASAALEDSPVPLEVVRAGDAQDPVVQGALRVSVELGNLPQTWHRAPRQVLARLHVLAAADSALEPEVLGRPRSSDLSGPSAAEEAAPGAGSSGDAGAPAAPSAAGVRDPLGLGAPPSPEEVAERLDTLVGLLTSATTAPAIVVAAVVHGELAALRPFGWGDGIVARAAARLTLVDRGLDPKSLIAPEVGHVDLGKDAYAGALRAYATGTRDGLARWVRHCAEAVELGARDALAICEALQRG